MDLKRKSIGKQFVDVFRTYCFNTGLFTNADVRQYNIALNMLRDGRDLKEIALLTWYSSDSSVITEEQVFNFLQETEKRLLKSIN